ncbi:MAG TPA: glycosyltransferase family 4 protein [Candidatus Paceibacterota bacterium]|nr:glycosyltransferase family 4 protein [Candidatus Paceibacterota bacterium]
MAKLLMITGLGSAADLASGKKGAFYNTLEEFHKYWERIDIIAPRIVRDVGNDGDVGNEQFQQAKRSNKRSDPTTQTQNLFGNVYVHISPWPLIFHPFWFLKKGLEIYKEQKFDLMTVHEFPPFYNGIGARLLRQKIKVPYILEIFHIPGHPRAASIKEVIYKFLFKLFIGFDASKAKAARVMNQKQVPDFLIKAGVPKEKIIYIPAIYVDLDIFRPMNLPKEYDLIFVGRLEKNKGINLLLETASKLKAQILNFKMIIVGSGPLKESLKFKIKNLKLQDNIMLYGWAKDSLEIAELMNKSKILMMPSYNEGGPRVVVEAMACGVPVLATPVGIVPDLLKNGSGGEIIAWEAEDMARKAKGLLDNPERYGECRLNGLETAKQFEKKETIKNYAEKLQKIYHE